MTDTNPILNSPYAEPRWHYATDTSGNLNYEDVHPERRVFEQKSDIHGLNETHKSHVNYVVADVASTREDANFWEHIAAKTLEELPEVQSFVKNAYCDFQIPYTVEGKERHYKPDFLVRCPLPNGETLMLILEITGANKQFKAEKKFYTETCWMPTVVAAYPQLRGKVAFWGGEWGYSVN